ncbi:MAG: hypothetical protein EOP06_01085 [Proteobacteria bacterium]|nr:MAG: hypothetical protein EOP06_01085 [Pseudomonadota bacterium]
MVSDEEKIEAALLAFLVGDAVGLPYEERRDLTPERFADIDMRYSGAHLQRPGTISDDSSVLLATMDSLSSEGSVNLSNIAKKLLDFVTFGRYTSHGEVFDIGVGTQIALDNIRLHVPPELAGLDGWENNGNGSLMRILPIAIFLRHRPLSEVISKAFDVSAITHRHALSQVTAAALCLLTIDLMNGVELNESLRRTQKRLWRYLIVRPLEWDKLKWLKLLFDRSGITIGTAFVYDTFWTVVEVLRVAKSTRHAIQFTIYLGGDTDTIAALAACIHVLRKGPDGSIDDWLQKIIMPPEGLEIIKTFASEVEARKIF